MTCVGHTFKADLTRVFRTFFTSTSTEFHPRYLDIVQVWRGSDPDSYKKNRSKTLASMCKTFLSLILDKSMRIRLGKWRSMSVMGHEYQRYAVLDAVCTLILYNKLSKNSRLAAKEYRPPKPKSARKNKSGDITQFTTSADNVNGDNIDNGNDKGAGANSNETTSADASKDDNVNDDNIDNGDDKGAGANSNETTSADAGDNIHEFDGPDNIEVLRTMDLPDPNYQCSDFEPTQFDTTQDCPQPPVRYLDCYIDGDGKPFKPSPEQLQKMQCAYGKDCLNQVFSLGQGDPCTKCKKVNVHHMCAAHWDKERYRTDRTGSHCPNCPPPNKSTSSKKRTRAQSSPRSKKKKSRKKSNTRASALTPGGGRTGTPLANITRASRSRPRTSRAAAVAAAAAVSAPGRKLRPRITSRASSSTTRSSNTIRKV